MRLVLKREWCGPECTIGTLALDGITECFTLEDVVREDGRPVNAWKIPGKTAIPTGTYPVIISYSQRFKQDLPLIENVQGFQGIRIHPGNTAADTEGCILVGRTKSTRSITESRLAFNALLPKLEEAIARGEKLTLEVA